MVNGSVLMLSCPPTISPMLTRCPGGQGVPSCRSAGKVNVISVSFGGAAQAVHAEIGELMRDEQRGALSPPAGVALGPVPLLWHRPDDVGEALVVAMP